MKNENIKSMILGAIIGDALGVPFEFIKRENLKLNPVVDMSGFGTHNQPKGTWSDDTSLTLCLIDTMINNDGKFDIWNFSMNASDWLIKNKFTSNGKVFDIGIATSNALIKFSTLNLHPSKCGGTSERDNGNGSLMRIHPLIIQLNKIDDINKRFNIVVEASSLTHNHVRSHLCCFFYIQFLIYLLNNYSKIDAYNSSCMDLLMIIDNLNLKNELINFDRILNNIYKLEEDLIYSSGYVVHTLEASLWCFFNSENYIETVLKAVNLGEDTDTVASISGAISGLFYGLEQIPKNWLDVIKKKEYIEDYSEKISKFV